MQPQDPGEVLDMIVEGFVVHPHIDVLCSVSGCTDTTKVADDKTEDASWFRIQRKAYRYASNPTPSMSFGGKNAAKKIREKLEEK